MRDLSITCFKAFCVQPGRTPSPLGELDETQSTGATVRASLRSLARVGLIRTAPQPRRAPSHQPDAKLKEHPQTLRCDLNLSSLCAIYFSESAQAPSGALVLGDMASNDLTWRTRSTTSTIHNPLALLQESEASYGLEDRCRIVTSFLLQALLEHGCFRTRLT